MTKKNAFLVAAAVAAATVNFGVAAPVSLTSLSGSQNFNAMSSTTLPGGWLIDSRTAAGGDNQAAVEATSGATGTSYRFGASDYAVGFLTSGSFGGSAGSPASITVEYINNTGSAITGFSNLSFAYEKYRTGSSAHNYTFQLGINGSYSAQAFGNYNFTADGSVGTLGTTALAGGTTRSGSVSSISIAPGATFSFRWNLVSGGSNGQATGIDDFSFTAVGAATNDTVLSLSPNPVAFGRVKQNASGVTKTIAISEAAGGSSTSANFTTSSTGGSGPAFTGFGAGTISSNGGSTNQTLTLNTSTTGAISRTVTLANGSNTADTAGSKSVTVSGNVVADRTINGTTAHFGKVLRSAPVAGTTTLSTPAGQSDSSFTRVTLSGDAQTAQGGVGLSAASANTFGTGTNQVDRTLSGQFTGGAGLQSGSYDIELSDEFGELRSVNVGYDAEVYDLGTPSLADSSIVTDGGSLALVLAQGPAQIVVPIHNLAGVDAAYTLGLEYQGATVTAGDPITITGFSGVLAAGQTDDLVLHLDTSSLAVGQTFSYAVTFLLANENQGVQGVNTVTGRSLTYTVAGTVVPEPASFALVGLAGLLIGRRRRA